ncbi:MAG: threonine synthase [Spirochaetia bacterium]|jgi:threonine synthase|nr:threonine synthase [Spirochaetia bacterium]
MKKPYLRSTMTGVEYPFDRLQEFAENGESLEVAIPGIEKARPKPGPGIWDRFSSFMPFEGVHPELSLGEGSTPLIDAGPLLKAYTGVDKLLLKNETMNPTWSFKDRGSLACAIMARERGESFSATISTGNMGQSMAAYGARASLGVMVFVPDFTPSEKILAMAMHGARVLRIGGADYADMKNRVLSLASRFSLRIVSGNGPIRAEGYKMEAFELYEDLAGSLPDFIVVPSSACGHIRGIFKGFRELLAAGLITHLPRMVVVQAAANSPLVSSIKTGSKKITPFKNFHTIAEALTSGNPPGGEEILDKAYEYGWLAEDASEEEILECQLLLAKAGFFVEPGSATTLAAVRKLRVQGAIGAGDRTVIVLTGSGLKDMDVCRQHSQALVDCSIDDLEKSVELSLEDDR